TPIANIKQYKKHSIESDTDKLIQKYHGKIKRLDLRKDNYKFFRNWKAVVYNLFFKSLEDRVLNLDPDMNFIFYDEIADYDYHGNLILYYIITELNELL